MLFDTSYLPAWVQEARFCSLPRLGSASGSPSPTPMEPCTHAQASLKVLRPPGPVRCGLRPQTLSLFPCRNTTKPRARGPLTPMAPCTHAPISLKLLPLGPRARRNPDHAQCCALLRLVAAAVHSWHERGMVHGAVTPQACHWFGAHNAVKLGSLSAWACCNGFMPVRPDVHYAAPEVRELLTFPGCWLSCLCSGPACSCCCPHHWSSLGSVCCPDCAGMLCTFQSCTWSCQSA